MAASASRLKGIAKSLGIVLLAALGSLGGLWAGSRLFTQQPRLPLQAASVAPPSIRLSPGDSFPREEFFTLDGHRGSFDTLLTNRESLLLLVNFDCQTCMELLTVWRASFVRRIRPTVQVIAFIPGAPTSVPEEYFGLLRGMTVLFHDDQYWQSTYHHVFWPTLVGVDASGFVVHVQVGFDQVIDYQLAKRFFGPH